MGYFAADAPARAAKTEKPAPAAGEKSAIDKGVAGLR